MPIQRLPAAAERQLARNRTLRAFARFFLILLGLVGLAAAGHFAWLRFSVWLHGS
jgi:hypothetical protein